MICLEFIYFYQLKKKNLYSVAKTIPKFLVPMNPWEITTFKINTLEIPSWERNEADLTINDNPIVPPISSVSGIVF